MISTGRLIHWRMLDDNPNEWLRTPRAQSHHDLSAWQEVILPVSVQEALWRAKLIPHPYRDLNSRAAEWVEHRDWVFGLDLDLAPPPEGRRTFIEFESVAGKCVVYPNGALVGQHEGPGCLSAWRSAHTREKRATSSSWWYARPIRKIRRQAGPRKRAACGAAWVSGGILLHASSR